MTSYKRILCIADTHFPYHHPDTIPFLAAIKKKYQPDKVVHMGDEVDNHSLSFHDSDNDLPAAGDELILANKCLKKLVDLFPEMSILESNHGSMALRKAKHHGIPLKYIRSYNEIYDVPKSWQWHLDLTLDAGGKRVYFHHGRSANILKASQEMGMCVVQGHYHHSFSIQYWANPLDLFWALQLGCSISKSSVAFAYDAIPVKRPLLGHAVILEGTPKLLPMLVDKNGRWNNVVS